MKKFGLNGQRLFVLLVITLFLNLPLISALEISNVRAEEITDRSAAVKWETDEAASSFVSYGADKENLETVGDAKSVYNHSFSLSGLLNSTTYFFKVKSGEEEDDKEGDFYSFDTLEADVVAPEIKAEIPELVGKDRIDIVGSTEEGAKVSLEVNGDFAGEKVTEGGNFSFAGVKLRANEENVLLISAEDKAGNVNSSEFKVFCDVSKPRIELKKLPGIVTESKIKLEGNLSENVSLSVLINNRSVSSEQTNKISVEVVLQEGENNISVVAEDEAGLRDEVKMKMVLSSKAPEIKAELTKGNSYYQGRAETDITGETTPGAKVYLYFFKREPFELTPDFSKAYAATTADEEGKFKFSGVNFEHPPIKLEDLAPKEIPAGLKEVVMPPFEVIKEQQQSLYEVYLIAEDTLDRVSVPAWRQVVTLYTCYTAEYAFHVDPLIEYQMPYRLDPDMMDEGRQIVSSIINLSYVGEGVATEEEEGFRIANVRFDKACTPGMVEEGGFKISCKIFPRLRPKPNNDKTAWFLQGTLARSDELSKRKDDFWDDLKDRQLVFPMKATISYQERGADGKWGDTKTQVSCFDLGYMVDIPLESKELIPDFLANQGVDALNWTIDKIDTVLPYLQKAMLVTGIGCGISILAKMATRYWRLFISKLEPWTDFGKEKKCPKKADEQNKLILESTAKGKGWTGPALTDENDLDKRCPMTAKAWKAESYLNTGLRWICDRFFCHEAPAGWTEDKEYGEILLAKQKEQSCGSEAGRCIPLREIENCKKQVDEKPSDFSPTTLKSSQFKWFLEHGDNVCYMDGEGFVYFYNANDPANDQAEETGIYKLQALGNRFGSKIGEVPKKSLAAYKPKEATSYCVAVDDTCDHICKKRTGFQAATSLGNNQGCYEIKEDGTLIDSVKEKIKTKKEVYVADFTRDCFPKPGEDKLKVCVCEKAEKPVLETTGKNWPRIAEKKEDWSYRQDQLFKETGGNRETCDGGKTGTCYYNWRYYSGRDMSAAFGANHVLDAVTGKEEITEINPFTQYLGAFQSVCISGIYNRLKLLQSTLIGMRDCLIEAKYTGLHDAGMCKEIFSQAVCGLVYKAIAYAAKGCLPIPFTDVGKTGNESVWGKGVGFGLGAIHGTLESTMSDLKDEYGNAKLNEYFSVGVQGVTKNICLAALGYDIPYGTDMLMDSAYRVPMKTTALVVPAERELISYNPVKGTAIYNYRVGASIFPGCKIRSYTVKLKCVGHEDLGKENVECRSFEDCPCLAASQTYAEGQKEKLIYSDVTGVEPGNYVSVPIQSPQTVDSLFRYDHVVLELQLDRFEKAENCFDKEYIEGNKGVFYFPITDVSAKPLVSCKIDPKTGTFTCPNLAGFFGAMGNTYFQAPYVECWNARAEQGAGAWKSCTALNNFLIGETIRIRPHILSDGKKQCLHITLGGVGENVYPIPEGMGPLLTPEYDLGVVNEELLGGAGAGSLAWTGAACGSPGYTKETGRPITYGNVVLSLSQEGNNYKLQISNSAAARAEAPYSIDASGYLAINNQEALTLEDIKRAVIYFGGYKITSPIANLGSCRYEVKSGGITGQSGVRSLNLNLELKYPAEGGDCMAATKPIKSALGSTSHRTSIKVQREEVYEVAGTASELHTYWKAKQYEALLDKAIGIINAGGIDLNNALAYYYAVAANVMLWKTKGDETYKREAKNYINLFNENKDKYLSDVQATTEYKKIDVYLRKIAGALS